MQQHALSFEVGRVSVTATRTDDEDNVMSSLFRFAGMSATTAAT
jgi:hypothetical protein